MPNAQRLVILTTLREQAGLSLSEMARRFGLDGTQSRKTVGAWERGELTPRQSRRAAFLGYLWDDLRLRKTPEQFEAVWDILIEEWGWEPISEQEWRALSTVPRQGSAPTQTYPSSGTATGALPHSGQAPLPSGTVTFLFTEYPLHNCCAF